MKKISRRLSIKAGLSTALCIVASRKSPATASTITKASTLTNKPPLNHLIRALLDTGKPVCISVADNLRTLPIDTRHYDLHLRNALLDITDVNHIAEAIDTVAREGGPVLQSFSMSYNANVGDEGVLTLTRTLPSTLTELGLVECGIKDRGGNALVDWAANKSALHWLCVEGNTFTSDTTNRFIDLRMKRKALLVVV